MKVLGLDTATDACTCALWQDGEVGERHAVAPQRHAELVLGMVDGLLRDAALALADLDAIAFGRGPGSFTGVRIAAGVVQGLTLGAGVPAVPVSTLQALAQGALRTLGAERVLAGFDARMGEVYWGTYEVRGEVMLPCDPDLLCAPDRAPVSPGGGWVGVGSAWERHGAVLRERLAGRVAAVHPDLLPAGRDVAALGAYWLERGAEVGPGEVVPVYLRDRVTAVPREGEGRDGGDRG